MSQTEHKALIERFYQAFSEKDYHTMAACYHEEASFSDAAFSLKGKAIGAMWHMLCERGKDLHLTWSVTEKDGVVTAHWEPVYTFSQTGNKVHNVIDARFEFKQGKILRHYDEFNFWRWSRQALGAVGTAMGWSKLLQSKVQARAAQGLQEFINKHPQYQ